MTRQEFMQKLQNYNQTALEKADGDGRAIFSRQKDEDAFTDIYESGMCLRPPYDFGFLRALYEESDVLQASIAAMVKNVVGMGYSLVYLGEDAKEIPSEALAEQQKLLDFFSEVNEIQGWVDVMANAWEDYEAVGNGAVEMIRNLNGELMFAYYHPVENLRKIAATDDDYIDDRVKIRRGGKVVEVNAKVYYRRYVARLPNGSLRYYKSLGDPRPLRVDNTMSGSSMLASELLWIENRKGILKYGLPRWIGATFDVAGRRDAQVLNWDALRSQGISPMAILVQGRLTDDSWDEIWNMIMGSKGVENFNKIWVLQVAATPTAVGAAASADVKIQDLSSAQKTDEMFGNYLKGTEDRIRQTFRVPAGFLGGTGAYSYGTLKIAKQLGEEQVFGPERLMLDNIINRIIVRKCFDVWNWRYKTKAAEVAGPEEIRNAISALVTAGAMSINNSVQLASDALGREFSQYPESWADYPLPVVLKVLDKFGMIEGMEEITGTGPELPMLPQSPSAPTITLPAAESEADEDEEKVGSVPLVLSEGDPDPFQDRGAVWAAAPRYTLYAFQQLKRVVRAAYKQAFATVAEQAASFNKGTLDEMVDAIYDRIQVEVVSNVHTEVVRQITLKMYYAVAKDVGKNIDRQIRGLLKKSEIQKKNTIPSLQNPNYHYVQNLGIIPTPVSSSLAAANFNWELEHQGAVKYFSNMDCLYLSKYLGEHNPQTNLLKGVMRNLFSDRGITTGAKKTNQILQDALHANSLQASFNGASTKYLDMMVKTGVARAQNWGAVWDMHEKGVKSYSIVGPQDARTCMYCWGMMGRTADVEKDFAHLLSTMAAGDESEQKIKDFSISNRFSGSWESLQAVSTEGIQKHGPACPPYHPRCRHSIVCHDFKVPVPLPKAVPEPVVAPIMPQQDVGTEAIPIHIPEHVPEPIQTPPLATTPPFAVEAPVLPTESGITQSILKYMRDRDWLEKQVEIFQEVEAPHTLSESTYPIKVYKDLETGDLWLYKKSGKRGSDAECAAYQLTEMIEPGKRCPVYSGECVKKLGHENGTLQRMIPVEQIKESSISVSSLSKAQTEQLMREQLVDYMIGNWDAHSRNFLILKDGSLAPVDKGQAWKFSGSDMGGLAQGNHLKGRTIYDELNNRFLDRAQADTGIPFKIDPKKVLGPLVKQIQALFTSDNLPQLTQILTDYRQGSVSGAQNMIKEMNTKAKGLTSEVNSLYQTILKKPDFYLFGKPKKPPKAKIPKGMGKDLADKIFDSARDDLKAIFAQHFSEYMKLTSTKLGSKDSFQGNFSTITDLLRAWQGSSSNTAAIVLKAIASRVEGLGDLILNSRKGNLPSRWQGAEQWIRSAGHNLKEVEEEYAKARAYGQAYIQKVLDGKVGTVQRGAKSQAVADLLSKETTQFPVEVREQVLASFSTSKRIANAFSGYNDSYVYKIINIPPEDVAFHDIHLPRDMEESEMIVRSRGGRKIEKNALESVTKTEALIWRELQKGWQAKLDSALNNVNQYLAKWQKSSQMLQYVEQCISQAWEHSRQGKENNTRQSSGEKHIQSQRRE